MLHTPVASNVLVVSNMKVFILEYSVEMCWNRRLYEIANWDLLSVNAQNPGYFISVLCDI